VNNTDRSEARPSCHFSIAADKVWNETKKRRKAACTIKTIIIAASALLSTEALRWCAAERVNVLIMDRNGECFSVFADDPGCKHARKDLLLRRRQFEGSRVKVAAAIVAMKIKALGLSRETQAVFLHKLARAKTIQHVLGAEAEASGMYWRMRKGFAISFKDNAPDGWCIFQGRMVARRGGRLGERGAVFGARHARHPLNAMLNYGYAVALAQTTRAIVGLGLDPCFGFLHGDKPERLSLSYDCLELIRTRIDRIVFDFAAARAFDRRELIEAE
jgi:CRISPR-associated protein Cas1